MMMMVIQNVNVTHMCVTCSFPVYKSFRCHRCGTLLLFKNGQCDNDDDDGDNDTKSYSCHTCVTPIDFLYTKPIGVTDMEHVYFLNMVIIMVMMMVVQNVKGFTDMEPCLLFKHGHYNGDDDGGTKR